MQFYVKKINTREHRYPKDGLMTILRESQFEFLDGESIDCLWIADQNIINLTPCEYGQETYMIELDNEYFEHLLATQE